MPPYGPSNECGRRSADNNPEDESKGESEEDSDDEGDNEENEYLVQHVIVEISDSEESKCEDPDYIYEGHGGSNASGQSDISSESTLLLKNARDC